MTAFAVSARPVEQFLVDTYREGPVEVVLVRGEVDGATAPLLRAVLDTVISRRPARVEVDLSGASFRGAHALAILTDGGRRLAARRAVLALRNPGPAARRLGDLAGLAVEVVDERSGPRPE